MLRAFTFLKRVQHRMIHSIPRRAIDRAGNHSVVFGFLWAIPAAYFFPEASAAEQLAICMVTAGMMAGAAFILSNVPPADGAHICIMGAAATTMLLKTGWRSEERRVGKECVRTCRYRW